MWAGSRLECDVLLPPVVHAKSQPRTLLRNATLRAGTREALDRLERLRALRAAVRRQRQRLTTGSLLSLIGRLRSDSVKVVLGSMPARVGSDAEQHRLDH